MYKKILVPVDLAHIERLDKALSTAADLARHYQVPVCYVGVSAAAPSGVAHTPQEFADKLESFAADQAAKHGLRAEAAAPISHDPAVDLAATLVRSVADNGADLVVMASHVPGLPEHIFSSNAGAVAAHATVSVFVVR